MRLVSWNCNGKFRDKCNMVSTLDADIYVIQECENSWPKYILRNFLSVHVQETFDLVAVWACRPYIEEYCIYQSINLDRITQTSVIIGDFNSNSIWDHAHGSRSHTKVTEELEQKGLRSAYHIMTGEQPGKETSSTFYLHRHLDKGFHIDYCFLAPSRLRKVSILDNAWISHSDHLPLLVELEE